MPDTQEHGTELIINRSRQSLVIQRIVETDENDNEQVKGQQLIIQDKNSQNN